MCKNSVWSKLTTETSFHSSLSLTLFFACSSFQWLQSLRLSLTLFDPASAFSLIKNSRQCKTWAECRLDSSRPENALHFFTFFFVLRSSSSSSYSSYFQANKRFPLISDTKRRNLFTVLLGPACILLGISALPFLAWKSWKARKTKWSNFNLLRDFVRLRYIYINKKVKRSRIARGEEEDEEAWSMKSVKHTETEDGSRSKKIRWRWSKERRRCFECNS